MKAVLTTTRMELERLQRLTVNVVDADVEVLPEDR